MPRSSVVKQKVAELAQHCCEYCRCPAAFSSQPFSADHIHPKSKGGKAVMENTAFACQGCNNHKYDKITGFDPVSKVIVPLYHPRQHVWGEHFAWNDNFQLLIGLTAIGRATIETLHLNRLEVVNIRRVLYMTGEHPCFLGNR